MDHHPRTFTREFRCCKTCDYCDLQGHQRTACSLHPMLYCGTRYCWEFTVCDLYEERTDAASSEPGSNRPCEVF